MWKYQRVDGGRIFEGGTYILCKKLGLSGWNKCTWNFPMSKWERKKDNTKYKICSDSLISGWAGRLGWSLQPIRETNKQSKNHQADWEITDQHRAWVLRNWGVQWLLWRPTGPYGSVSQVSQHKFRWEQTLSQRVPTCLLSCFPMQEAPSMTFSIPWRRLRFQN